MKKMTLLIGCLLLALGIGLGCCECEKDKPAATGPELKTVEEYREEAAREINEKNAEEELKKLKAEIEADR